MPQLVMPRPTPTLRSALVTLRPPVPARDAQDYFEMNLEPEMHTWTGNAVLETPAHAQQELERYASMDDVSTWMIVDNESRRVIGRFFLEMELRAGLRVAGEGNRIAKPYWRKGHNRAARALIFSYAFGDLAADRIDTWAWECNVNSIRSIEHHGFVFERTEREWNEKHGCELAKRHYTLTREKWASSEHYPG